jgi:hypothetical protein
VKQKFFGILEYSLNRETYWRVESPCLDSTCGSGAWKGNSFRDTALLRYFFALALTVNCGAAG